MQTSSASYQELQSVLARSQGCPICHVGLKAGHRYLDGLLWESVNDSGVRHKLTVALGLCSRHSRELLTFHGERMGVAIIQRTVLQEALRRLETDPVPNRPSRFHSLGKCWGLRRPATQSSVDAASPNHCPACVQQTETESWALAALLEHLPGDLDVPLQAVGGLCWSHLQTALQECGQTELRGVLIDVHRQLWASLTELLDEFVRKHDYRFHHEPIPDSEQVAIERTMAILTGEYPRR